MFYYFFDVSFVALVQNSRDFCGTRCGCILYKTVSPKHLISSGIRESILRDLFAT